MKSQAHVQRQAERGRPQQPPRSNLQPSFHRHRSALSRLHLPGGCIIIADQIAHLGSEVAVAVLGHEVNTSLACAPEPGQRLEHSLVAARSGTVEKAGDSLMLGTALRPQLRVTWNWKLTDGWCSVLGPRYVDPYDDPGGKAEEPEGGLPLPEARTGQACCGRRLLTGCRYPFDTTVCVSGHPARQSGQRTAGEVGREVFAI